MLAILVSGEFLPPSSKGSPSHSIPMWHSLCDHRKKKDRETEMEKERTDRVKKKDRDREGRDLLLFGVS